MRVTLPPWAALLFGATFTAATVGPVLRGAHRTALDVESMAAVELAVVEANGRIALQDEILTDSARLAALTGDASWVERYDAALGPLDAALATVARLAPDAVDAEANRTIAAANTELVRLETSAFDAVARGDLDAARGYVFGPEYARQKAVYRDGMATLSEGVAARTAARTAAARSRARDVALLAGPAGVASIAVWAVVSVSLSRHARQRDAERRLVEQERDLLVAERRVTHAARQAGATPDRSRVDLDAARRAGRADVASEVLHRVGNAVTSVRVGVDLARASLDGALAARLRRLASALGGPDHDPAVSAYVLALADTVDAERRQLRDELDQVLRQTDRVAAALAEQADHARPVPEVREPVAIDGLLRDVAAPSRPGAPVRVRGTVDAVLRVDRDALVAVLRRVVARARDRVAPGDAVEIEARADSGVVWFVVSGGADDPIRAFRDVDPDTLHAAACRALELGGQLTASEAEDGRVEWVLTVPRAA